MSRKLQLFKCRTCLLFPPLSSMPPIISFCSINLLIFISGSNYVELMTMKSALHIFYHSVWRVKKISSC
ncbi:Uncharacterized protein TCM_026597 [Theobroma cacao]|uniref:Uncharacterized protein n=1 Tax=Theobroma cacao TaxID=3641 RepID=A0A061F248_THECC|nr:Uncharacterized protein TCM_026597 [Theobroma cacao]